MWKMYRGPSIRIRHRKGTYWSVSLMVAAVGAVAALLVLGLSDGRSAQAQTTRAVVVGARDISSCDSTGDEATAQLLGNITEGNTKGTVLALGDNAYTEGSLAQYNNCYGPTWGRHITRTRPTVGNHEYRTGPYPPARPATSTTSARRPQASEIKATIPTTGHRAPGTSSC